MTTAETYDRLSDFQLESGKAIATKLAIARDARVLDVGCGTGRLTDWLAERVGAVTGIDPLADRIEVARSRGGAATFAIGRAEDLACFADASFDAVLLSSVFHWVADRTKALAEARRVLRSGGRLGVSTVARELSRAGTIGQVLDGVLAGYAGRVDRGMLAFGARGGCTTTELLSLVVEAQLDLVELHVTEHAHTHASGEAVVDFMESSAFGTLLGRLHDDELRSSLRADLTAAFEARKGEEGVVVRAWDVQLVAMRG